MFVSKWDSLKEYDSVIGTIVSNFMEANDVKTIATGRWNLENGCYVNVDEYETRINNCFEAHRAYVDVQLMVDGEEEIFCAPLSHGVEAVAFDEQKDVAFYNCDKGPYCTVTLKPQMAVVLMPFDMHAPCNAIEKRCNRKLVFKIPIELLKENKKKKVACCGDSITFGLLATSTGKSYPKVLQQLAGDSLQIRNFGRNGATVIADYELLPNRYAPYLKSPEYAMAMLSEPDIVVLMLGMNDGNPTHHFNAENGGPMSVEYSMQYEDTLKLLIDNLSGLPSNPQIVLCKTTAMKRTVCKQFSESYVNDFTNNLLIIRAIQEKVADEYQIPLVDTLQGMDNMDYYRDGCHMTDAGYEQLAKKIYKYISN